MSEKIEIIRLGEEGYPELLKHIKNPPQQLYYIGDLGLASRTSVAIVGSRRATAYGIWAAETLGQRLSENGVTVISGLARGIDSAGHKGALKTINEYDGIMGSTVAVMGCGVDICYPATNRTLRNRIAEKGLIISEYPPGFPAAKYTFPQRNRIISGIAVATVTVEAAVASGSLITAECAGEQGRGVYAVPGNINNINSLGTNKLIKDGACPLIVLDDMLDDLGIKNKKNNFQFEALGKAEKEVYGYLQKGAEFTIDEVCALSGKTPAEVNGIVTVLEIKGMIYTSLGKIFIANV